MASTPTTVTPPSTPIMPSTLIEQLNDSWCELKFKSGCSSTGSIKNHLNQSVNPEVLEKLLNEAQRETTYPSTSISVQSSPKTPHTPNDSLTPHPYQHYIDTNCTSCVSLVANTKNPTSNNTTSTMLATMPQTSTSNISLNKDTDWIWYWSSRPQMQPPKEWNFIHPNSAKSKYSMRQHELMDNKLLSRDTINKLIFTHMASFILGATL